METTTTSATLQAPWILPRHWLPWSQPNLGPINVRVEGSGGKGMRSSDVDFYVFMMTIEKIKSLKKDNCQIEYICGKLLK